MKKLFVVLMLVMIAVMVVSTTGCVDSTISHEIINM